MSIYLIFVFIFAVAVFLFVINSKNNSEENGRPNYEIDETITDHKTASYDLLRELAQKHVKVLRTKAHQSVYHDDYGNPVLDDWIEDFSEFLERVYLPECEKRGINIVGTNVDEWFEIVNNTVTDFSPKEEGYQEIEKNDHENSLTPLEFEHFCKDILVSNGWNARVTQATGDQGVDIIAEKDSLKAVIQCKYYKTPVGNKAVQEIYSAKQHELADLAAVVTNSKYTKSAQELSRTCGVLLLHHTQLNDFDNLIENFSE